MAEKGPGDQLVEQWQAGVNPEDCFRRIFLHYYGPVHLFFVNKGFSSDDSNDLAQETFLRIHKSLSTFRGESRFDTWVYQIAANIFRNTLRDRSTLKRGAQEVSLEGLQDQISDASLGYSSPVWEKDDEGPLANLLADERHRVLWQALGSLPPQMRRCVILRIAQDLKYREIADLMKVSIETVKAHLFQARQQLKGKLARYFDDLDFE
ncbi:MAG TPA: sigma-70 family RNA polymerase sigma factor [Thermoanaerobaculia bacterium]|nr:sigma-70 family RNA polymerase sigma factor [Thermoanaerobaculia bacterium]